MYRISHVGSAICLALAAALIAAPALGAKRVAPAAERYRIASPADGAQVGPEPLSLVVEGIDGATFSALRLWVDGRRAEERALQLPQPQSRWTLKSDVSQLRPGEHLFAVDVYPAPGVSVRLKLRLVTRGTPPAAVAAPPTAPAGPAPADTPPAGTPPTNLSPVRQKLWSARRLLGDRPDEAERLVREALRECGENGDPQERAEALSCLREVGRALYTLGHRAFIAGTAADARSYLERALVIAHEYRDPTVYFGGNADMIALLVRAGELPQARMRLARLEEVLAEMPFAPSYSQVALLTRYATALSLVGRLLDAVTCLDRAGTMLAEVEQTRPAVVAGDTPPTVRISNEAAYARYWSAWMRAYLDALKAQPAPPRAAVETLSQAGARLLERLTGLSKEAEEVLPPLPARAGRNAPVRRGLLRQLDDDLAAAQALKAEIDALPAGTRGAAPPAADHRPRPIP